MKRNGYYHADYIYTFFRETLFFVTISSSLELDFYHPTWQKKMIAPRTPPRRTDDDRQCPGAPIRRTQRIVFPINVPIIPFPFDLIEDAAEDIFSEDNALATMASSLNLGPSNTPPQQ